MNTNIIKKRDGRYVISPRENKIEEMVENVKDVQPKGVVNGLRHLTRTPAYQRLRLLKELEELGYEIPTADATKSVEDFVLQTEKKHKKKKKNKDKKKHKKFKNKKGFKKMSEHISNNLTERNERNSNLMAELLKRADELLLIDDCLWVYNSKTGCYDNCNVNNIAAKLRLLLPEKERMKVSSHEYKEAYNQLIIADELVSTKPFFSNKPFVNCVNGVVDVKKGKLLEHSHSYMFKHYIRAKYDPEAKCKKFLSFVDWITDGDDDMKTLLSAIMGYILSHYNNAKTAFLLYGESNTGKSVICKILSEIIGDDYVSNSDLSDLQKQEFAATLSGKILNVAPDLKNGNLKDIGSFKALTSHNDTIAARALYANPCKVKGETKMLFSTNHLLAFDSKVDIGDIEAVFNRFLFFPFLNKPITKDEDKKNYSDEILEEADGIFTWAMDGLKTYLENGENFPYAKHSQKLKEKNMMQFCPEKIFFEKCLVVDDSSYESTEVVKAAYEDYCDKNEVIERGNIREYITKHKRFVVKKKRIDDEGNLISTGSPRATYVGVSLKNKYRVG